MKSASLLIAIVGLHASAAGTAGGRVASVQAALETPPVASSDDAADDVAIWVDAQQPQRSVVIGTDKRAGLHIYDLQGRVLQSLSDGRMNNVDLRDGFPLGAERITVVAATNRTDKSIALYQLDHSARRLRAIADGVQHSGLDDPYGLCMYRSRTGAFYVFANNDGDGKVRQWRLVERNRGIALELVREFAVGSQAEACVADDSTGRLYVAEEDVGLWRYSAEPDGGAARAEIDRVDGDRIEADVEGLAIYSAAGDTGFLIVSSQGDNRYAVYRREGANEYLGSFAIVANERGAIDGVTDTDGLEVASASLGPQFPAGLLVVQDGKNEAPPANQNFKYVSWLDVRKALELQ